MSLLRIVSRSSLRSIRAGIALPSSASRLLSSLPSSASASSSVFSHRSFSTKKATSIKVDDPYEGSIFTEVPLHDESQSLKIINDASNAQSLWKTTTLEQRISLLKKMMAEFEKNKDSIAADISHQMGKPLKQAKGEVDGCIARARTLCDLAPEALASVSVPSGPGFFRQITKEPIGVVLVLVPWNYPLLCTINALGAALLAGNSVIIKQSDRTPLCADHFSKAFESISAPSGLVQSLHVDHSSLSKIFSHPSISYVSFTGSVPGGRAVYESVAKQRFIDVGLELGGKDAAYVSENVDLPFAIENVVDGAMYNAGQSCCAVERVYVHKNHYEAFLKGATDIVKSYKLGSPFDSATSMGPIAQPRHPSYLASLVDQAKAKGARVLVGGKTTHDTAGKGRFFAPTVVADANHSMSIMVDEAFGPILTVAKVGGDEEAIKLMNDSPFGLTASVWTKDELHANKLVQQLNVGTVFMNRCDFLDPMLPWSGRKDSGKGYGLSTFGFLPYIRTKGYNFRTKTS